MRCRRRLWELFPNSPYSAGGLQRDSTLEATCLSYTRLETLS